MKKPFGFPPKQGLYNPAYERDACGIGLIAHIKGQKSNQIVRQSLEAGHLSFGDARSETLSCGSIEFCEK